MAVRLTKQAWHAIKSEYLRGRSAKDLAQQFGVSPGAIHSRSSLERWRESIPVPPAQMIERQTVAAENLTRQGGAA